MTSSDVRLPVLAAKTIVVHTVTYMIMGMLAYSLLDYESAFARPEMACWMRPLSDPLIMAGPLFQPIRGLVFALVIYLIRGCVFNRRRGWLVLWAVLVGLAVVNTFGPAPGSVEGLIYTVIPVGNQLAGYLEVVPQALMLALIVVHWVEHPEKRWLTWVMTAAFVLAMGLPVLGILARGAAM